MPPPPHPSPTQPTQPGVCQRGGRCPGASSTTASGDGTLVDVRVWTKDPAVKRRKVEDAKGVEGPKKAVNAKID
jgi:hypothetical protein